ncbi:hypothetical protein BELL_0715g00050 [Botrytis elliptica]|uniref:Uncharacterized protein n=1 Tax=Botrytis elliptica TaxID=278938 RepID=A0A4Z1JAC7_9HELO|nr:hypothetical protein EAE99_005349 [Botrytis elliptica]TGO70508.1 hypothetical protein BELL_0715g00050 [Botrytis elliptica]
MAKLKPGVKGKGKAKAKPKSAKEKSKVRANVSRQGDVHRRVKVPVPTNIKNRAAKKPIVIDLTSSSPPPPLIKKVPPPPPPKIIATPQKQNQNQKHKLALSSLSTSERSPGIHSPITRSLSLSLAKPLIPENVFNISTRKNTTTQPPEYYIQSHHINDITPGTVVWLPSKEDIVHHAYVDPKLHVNAFDHPAVIVSMPNPANGFSVVEIAIMTSLGSRTLHETKKLGHRSLLFRVRTAQLPSAKVDITFKEGKGMKGKYSFVNCRESWRVQIGTLGFYARGRGTGQGRNIEWLRLTTASLDKLRASIGCGKGLWG